MNPHLTRGSRLRFLIHPPPRSTRTRVQLLNLPNVTLACELIHEQLGLSARSIVISTVGETHLSSTPVVHTS